MKKDELINALKELKKLEKEAGETYVSLIGKAKEKDNRSFVLLIQMEKEAKEHYAKLDSLIEKVKGSEQYAF